MVNGIIHANFSTLLAHGEGSSVNAIIITISVSFKGTCDSVL